MVPCFWCGTGPRPEAPLLPPCGRNGALPYVKFSASLGRLSSADLSVLGWSPHSDTPRLAPIRHACGYPPPNPIRFNMHIRPICNSLRDLSSPLFLSTPFQLIFLTLTIVCARPFPSLLFPFHFLPLLILSLAHFPLGKFPYWITYLYPSPPTTSFLYLLILRLLSPVLLQAMAALFRITRPLAG